MRRLTTRTSGLQPEALVHHFALGLDFDPALIFAGLGRTGEEDELRGVIDGVRVDEGFAILVDHDQVGLCAEVGLKVFERQATVTSELVGLASDELAGEFGWDVEVVFDNWGLA